MTQEAHPIYPSGRFYVLIESMPKAVFTELTGLQIETEVMEYAEGGNNRFVHRLPGRTKVSNITLKRGITSSNELFMWYLDIAHGKQFTPRNLSVVMYDTAGREVVRWHFIRAYPVKWIGPQLTAGGAQAAIETLELAHDGIQIG
jgi:phage tail-like protein